jgi:integrase/recombinase XerD
MTRPLTPRDNPNIFLGCHPCIPLGDQSLPFSDESAQPLFPAGRPPSLSIREGVIRREQCSKRRQTLDRVLIRVARRQLPGGDHLIEYLRLLYRRNCKPRTICNCATSLVFFLSVLASVNKAHLELITRRDVEAFVESEQDRGIKITTVKLRLQNIYGFLRYLCSQEILRPDILERKIRLKVPNPLPKALAPEETARLLSVIDTTRDRALILMLLRTGMRIGELCNLRVNDVDLTERMVKIYQGEKNSVGRVLYISDDACRALSLWIQQRQQNRPYLFYGLKGPLSYSAARERFIELRDKAGLAAKGYTLHSLRHTFATDLLNAGMRLECLQQLMGHSNIEVTRIYAKLSDTSRHNEYFRAMAKIERGEIDAPNRLDHQL